MAVGALHSFCGDKMSNFISTLDESLKLLTEHAIIAVGGIHSPMLSVIDITNSIDVNTSYDDIEWYAAALCAERAGMTEQDWRQRYRVYARDAVVARSRYSTDVIAKYVYVLVMPVASHSMEAVIFIIGDDAKLFGNVFIDLIGSNSNFYASAYQSLRTVYGLDVEVSYDG